MVTKPTRKKNILDLFLTTNSTLIQQSIVALGVSDHDGIPIIDMATRPKINKPKPRKIYQYHKANLDNLKSDLQKLSNNMTNRANSTKSTSSLWTEFKDGIQKAMDDHIPTSVITKKQQTPWINAKIRSDLYAENSVCITE